MAGMWSARRGHCWWCLFFVVVIVNCYSVACYTPPLAIQRLVTLKQLATRRIGPSVIRRQPTMASAPSSVERSGRRRFWLKALEVLGKSTRWSVAGVVGAVLLVRRDAAMVSFVFGAMVNAFIGKTLKRVIREARPEGALLDDHGMPSSHAMSLFYITAFVSRAARHGLPHFWPLSYWPTVALLVSYVVTASYWRVLSGLHTSAQICVGASLGGTAGLVWQRCCESGATARVAEYLGGKYADGRVPLSYTLFFMSLGALTVGSVERKIEKYLRKAREQAAAVVTKDE